LIRIINDILDISKIEAGKTTLHPKAVALRDLATVAAESVVSIARPAGVDVTVSVDPALPLVLADPDRMVQVLVNLLSNAIKFSPRDSQVSVSAIAKDAMVEVAVQDHGDGIAPENLERLFQKFEQLEGAAMRKKGGTGLGLAIVKGLVEQHGGSIRVESARGQGARFIFTIPTAPRGAAATPLPSGTTSRGAASGTVLIVDDDGDFRLVVRKQLERAGYVVVEAGDGDEGLIAARDLSPDVITLDLMMPGMNGWELLRHLSDDELLRTIPVIVISAVAEQAGELAREVAVMQKPVDIDVLLTQIRAHGIAHMVKPVDPIDLARRVGQLIKPR
jgi:CheY-like chemotaxis protein